MNDAQGDLLEANSVVAHRYRVVRYLGDRGFGQVYEAEDTAMEVEVALMRLDKEFSHPRVRESFFETRATAQVEDHRVVDLTDYGEDLDGRLFLVMPWIEQARALDEIVARHGAMPWAQAKAIVQEIAAALEAAHAKGTLHGGLALCRVLLDPDDGVHIVDFGLAPALTRPGGQVVTNVSPLPRNTAYLAPEQVRGEPVDARSDIYALGVMLWELVSGAPPFVGNPLEIANAHLESPLPELTRRGAPAELEALLHLALTKAKDERIASAEEFSSLLRAMPGAAVAGARPALGRTPTQRVAPQKPAAKAKPAPASRPKLAVAPPPKSSTAKATRPLAPAVATKAPALVPASPPPAPVAIAKPAPAAKVEPEHEHEPEHDAAIPQPIGIPQAHDSATAASPSPTPTPPPRKRRLGKLEIAILAFLAFDLLVFAGWKLFGGAPTPDEIAEVEPSEPDAPASAAPVEPSPEPDTTQDIVEPDTTQEASAEPSPSDPKLSVHEAIAAEFPDGPASTGPVRPLEQSLSDKDFREVLVETREDVVARCLDTRMRRTLKVQLKVSPEGKVTYTRVLGSLSDTELGRCVLKQVYGADFPATVEGGTHVYTMRLR